MISNVDKNVILIKDIPSNIIEEAIFILKENVSDRMLDTKIELAKAESELFLQGYIDDEIADSLKQKVESERSNKQKKHKIICIILAVIFSIIINSKL